MGLPNRLKAQVLMRAHSRCSSNRAPYAVSLASRAFPRAKSMRLIDLHDGLQDLQWPTAAPHLESLTVLASVAIARTNYHIPDEFILGSFPNLRSVQLRGCTLAWRPTSFFRGLTVLEIYHRGPSRLMPEVSKVLETLQSMQSLERFSFSLDSLAVIIETENDQPILPTAELVKVDLPRLAVLEFKLHASTTIAMLSKISHPRERLDVFSPLSSVDHVRDLTRCFKDFRMFKVQQGLTMSAMRLRDKVFWCLDVCDLSCVQEACPLSVGLMIPKTLQRQFLDEIGEQLPFVAMEAVMVDSSSTFATLRPYLGQCKTLCASRLDVAQDQDFFLQTTFARADGSPWFPALQTLVVHNLDLSVLPKTSSDPLQLTVPLFMNMFKSICPYFRNLKFFDCSIYSQGKLNSMRRYVSHIENHVNTSTEPMFDGIVSAMRAMLA